MKNKKDFTTISIKKTELKKLEDYKQFDSEPMWHVIKRLIEDDKTSHDH